MATLKRWPNWPAPAPIFYRLYHDAAGRPLFYSMEDVPGTYVEIDQETYARNSMQVRVRDGRVVPIQHHVGTKLVPSDQGTACHSRDVCIVVAQEPYQRWSLKSYETS